MNDLQKRIKAVIAEHVPSGSMPWNSIDELASVIVNDLRETRALADDLLEPHDPIEATARDRVGQQLTIGNKPLWSQVENKVATLKRDRQHFKELSWPNRIGPPMGATFKPLVPDSKTAHPLQTAELLDAPPGPPGNEGLAFEMTASAINAYIPHGRPYDVERNGLQRYLARATDALRANESPPTPPPIKPTPGETWIYAELVRAPIMVAGIPSLALVKLPANCLVVSPPTVGPMDPLASAPVRDLERSAQEFARVDARAPTEVLRAALQRDALGLALWILQDTRPRDEIIERGWDEAEDTLGRFRVRAGLDAVVR